MEQPIQQSMQGQIESKIPVKTNWKYLAIVAVFVLFTSGGIVLVKVLSPAPIAPTPLAVQPTPPPSPQPQALDTSGWQTYRNDEFGFEVKQPSDWLISFEYKIITFKPYRNSGSFLSIAPLGTGLESIFDKENGRIQQTTFAGRSAKEFPQTFTDIGGGAKSIDRVIRVGDIQSIPWGQENEIRYQVWYTEPELVETFNQILSTFRFVE